ncbi:MAG: beta-ketoacyl-ACP synthase [Bauldia sp.]
MANDVWITGIGLISSLGEGLDAHWHALTASPPTPIVDRARFAPYVVHPMAALDLDKQIPKRGDQRQMEPWQRFGTYAAGLALADAGLAGDAARLDKMDMILACGGGERDVAADTAILEAMSAAATPDAFLNERLNSDLRPTLFLAQLPNLLAGNISIVHKVTGSSRTFMGEETAGISALDVARRRVAAGQSELMLVGGATNAERADILLQLSLGGRLARGGPQSVWQRAEGEGGLFPGSSGAFLVLESPRHAAERGRAPYARLSAVAGDRSRRRPGDAAAVAARQLSALKPLLAGAPPVLSGATGMKEATHEEREWLAGLAREGTLGAVRGVATALGSLVEATVPALTALAALAIARRGFPSPFDDSGVERPFAGAPEQVIVTSWGYWRGEGMALVEAVR